MIALLNTLVGSAPGIVTGDEGGGIWMPPRASTIADSVDGVFFFIFWICVFFFVLIVGAMILFCVKYRRREHVQATGGTTHNTTLEVTWTAIPLVLVIAIFYVGLDGYVDLMRAPENSYPVRVTGQQWSWTFEHLNGTTDVNLLTVPAGRPVKLTMTSTDVLHAVFIPAFRVKQDLVPGRYTFLWFEAPEPGMHQLFCAEYCGTEHAQMTAMVEVLAPDDFEREMERRANILDTLTRADYPTYFLDRIYPRCVSCHLLTETVKQGPGFAQTHRLWGKTRVMKDGREVTVDENYIRKSVLNPQADIVANTSGQMATFKGQLTDLQIEAIIEFVKRMDEFVDDQGERIEQGTDGDG